MAAASLAIEVVKRSDCTPCRPRGPALLVAASRVWRRLCRAAARLVSGSPRPDGVHTPQLHVYRNGGRWMERRSKRPLLARQGARHRGGGVGSGRSAADALHDAPGGGIRAAAMVKRFISILFLAAVTTAAAIGAHHFAVIEVHWDAPVGGIAAGLIASVMFLFLLVLALRYLLMLGLAAYAQSQ